MTTPAILRLRQPLKDQCRSYAAHDLAELTGVPFNVIHRACTGRAIGAEPYLILCAAIGIDPANGSPCEPRRVGNILWGYLGWDLMRHRLERGLDQRAAAKLAGLTHPVICRLEAGRAVSIESLTKICFLIGKHPASYTVLLCSARRQSFTGNSSFTKQNQGAGHENAVCR